MDYYRMNNYYNDQHTKIELEMLSFGISLLMLTWFGSVLFGWCRDPLATELQKKIDHLESENDDLIEQLNDVESELSNLKKNVNAVDEMLETLQKTLHGKTD